MTATSPDHGTGPLGRRGSHRLCVAPMMDWTDRHCRSFHRLFGPEIVLYTEMVTAKALIHGDAAALLAYGEDEHPIALQLGGSEPDELARAARLGADAGYDEINLNVGCPSDRVASGSFGACLMAEPERVADCVAAMRAEVSIPVTVKCRLGIETRTGDEPLQLDSDAHLTRFVDTVAAAGCSLFLVHARKAILGGLSPKENREIPPLQHHRIHELAARRPGLEIVLNGGLAAGSDWPGQLERVEGLMIGRAAYQQPMVLAEARRALFGTDPEPEPLEILEAFLPRVRERLEAGVPLSRISRHLLGILHGRPGARAFRRHLSEQAPRRDAGIEVLEAAIELARQAARRLRADAA